MNEQDMLTNELVEQVLTVLPQLPKKIFGLEPSVKSEGLHPSHFHVLHIVEQANSIQMTDIAAKLAINKSNLSPLIRKLVERGYISKIKDKRDRRITHIEMTVKGQQFSQKNKSILYESVRERFSSLAQEDKKELNEAFTKINQILSQIEE
ncbi:MarR family winged helix-turn-helix transcriptional regulator [Gracilibacillus kekensis]|uniref:DNA-binding transcriptional regulator, MarR family n=1 Tax=Gracilibacillus kekensis TaxID=1027249 RepID=A0A1M7PYP3_9BACI|nr:MarR family transcriptional regulator [Gracilibacillus kekensis]SHN22966.1 DNA-binding transcriptional regulator, MarR family [Gracilibacillus kekensis]